MEVGDFIYWVFDIRHTQVMKFNELIIPSHQIWCNMEWCPMNSRWD